MNYKYANAKGMTYNTCHTAGRGYGDKLLFGKQASFRIVINK